MEWVRGSGCGLMKALDGYRRQKTLFFIGTYTIGKEKILVEVALRCGIRLHVPTAKLATLRCLNLEHTLAARGGQGSEAALDRIFTTNTKESCVRVVMMNSLGFDSLNKELETKVARGEGYTHVVAFRPTGWSGAKAHHKTRGKVTIHSVPYSEHSTFAELRQCVAWLKPSRIIPTVSAHSKVAADKQVAKFRDLMSI